MFKSWLRLWRSSFRRSATASSPTRGPLAVLADAQASATIFLILRRMRAPLIVLILIFAVSVLGLTLVPGQDADGKPWRMGFFDAFYFMSYTATTIGFGELPYAFTDAQRLWVTLSIYLTVIGWAYAIGALLTLLQDQKFRQALARQHFQRRVGRLREPFLLIAGYGETGKMLARSFDQLGRRFVVIDKSAARIDALDLASYNADVPGLVADARNPRHLGLAGLEHTYCDGVLALTDNDEVNLAVVMAAALLRPEIPVVARSISPVLAHRMRAFGTPTVINPFDRFGEQLVLALRAPASFQLTAWLEGGPGAELPPRGHPPTGGRWVICGYGRFGRELTGDLHGEGFELTIIDPDAKAGSGVDVIKADGSEPGVLTRAHLDQAVGFVAGTDNDTTNLSLIAAARRMNPELYLAGRQNKPANAPLFSAMHLDSLLVPTELVAHEAYAQLSTPLLWRFLQEMPAKGDDWAAALIARLAGQCGEHLKAMWKIRLTPSEAPALTGWLSRGEARLGDLWRSPTDRNQPLHAVPLLVLRDNESILAPDPDFVLAPEDQLLIAGRRSARNALRTTLILERTMEYVVHGRSIPSSWIWRRISRRTTVPRAEVAR